MIEHTMLFERFSKQQAEHVPAWLEMVLAWEVDHEQPNPYVVPQSGKLHVVCISTQGQALTFLQIFRHYRSGHEVKIGRDGGGASGKRRSCPA
jgi:hypothetical protein